MSPRHDLHENDQFIIIMFQQLSNIAPAYHSSSVATGKALAAANFSGHDRGLTMFDHVHTRTAPTAVAGGLS